MGEAQWTVVPRTEEPWLHKQSSPDSGEGTRANPDFTEKVCRASGVPQTSAMKEIRPAESLERVQFNHSSVKPWRDTLQVFAEVAARQRPSEKDTRQTKVPIGLPFILGVAGLSLGIGKTAEDRSRVLPLVSGVGVLMFAAHQVSKWVAMHRLRSRCMTPKQIQSAVDQDLVASAQVKAMATFVDYAKMFLAKPLEGIGRDGPVCPFMPKSLALDSVYVCPMTEHSVEDVRRAVVRAKKVFIGLHPQMGPRKFYKALILMFPEMSHEDAPHIIDIVQNALKTVFVEEGLMLGEFHMHTNTSGLRSTSFRPLRAPFPCLAIRQMVPSDLAFLAHDLDHIISFERQLRRPSFVGNSSQVEENLVKASKMKELLM
eukprot:CAMPEP_0194489084 /NCGR_PEP_ID=MMETSP0253-20130528/8757_1 /TAXON_ID=2966 /ORGANISM="Noctiluca scintillans" /LENGTH=371 /DNA_ID=CAMNT_0039329511 /DNA_START=82 /DNA_END=1197 /DNA_ORIENTATION=-